MLYKNYKALEKEIVNPKKLRNYLDRHLTAGYV
jgi:hypothetical protein